MVMLGPASLTLGSWTGMVCAPVQAERNPLPRSRGCLNPSSSATTDCNSINGSPTLSRLPTQRVRGRRSTFKFQAAVTAVDSDQLGSPDSAEKGEAGEKKKYYFVVANAKFMLDEEEHFKEVLFERLRNYGERDKEQDFWLVIEPKFLDKFPNITKRLKRPAVALVSTNAPWITFMKLRLDRVLSESYEADSLQEALASNPTNIEFEKPENWVAPYPKYESGWWEPFLPPPTHHQNLS